MNWIYLMTSPPQAPKTYILSPSLTPTGSGERQASFYSAAVLSAGTLSTGAGHSTGAHSVSVSSQTTSSQTIGSEELEDGSAIVPPPSFELQLNTNNPIETAAIKRIFFIFPLG